jgi:PR domain zinc finger protein 1
MERPSQHHNGQQQQQQPSQQEIPEMCNLREADYERLTVYIVPDVPCPQGTQDRAEKTLPRSLTLKPSVVLSTPNTPVNFFHLKDNCFF